MLLSYLSRNRKIELKSNIYAVSEITFGSYIWKNFVEYIHGLVACPCPCSYELNSYLVVGELSCATEIGGSSVVENQQPTQSRALNQSTNDLQEREIESARRGRDPSMDILDAISSHLASSLQAVQDEMKQDLNSGILVTSSEEQLRCGVDDIIEDKLRQIQIQKTGDVLPLVQQLLEKWFDFMNLLLYLFLPANAIIVTESPVLICSSGYRMVSFNWLKGSKKIFFHLLIYGQPLHHVLPFGIIRTFKKILITQSVYPSRMYP